MQTVTKGEIKHIANLAKLEFTEDELAKFESEFNNILEYVSSINECDTSGIEFEHNMEDYSGEILQDDIVVPSLNRDKALLNASDGRAKNGYVKTSKIVTKD